MKHRPFRFLLLALGAIPCLSFAQAVVPMAQAVRYDFRRLDLVLGPRWLQVTADGKVVNQGASALVPNDRVLIITDVQVVLSNPVGTAPVSADTTLKVSRIAVAGAVAALAQPDFSFAWAGQIVPPDTLQKIYTQSFSSGLSVPAGSNFTISGTNLNTQVNLVTVLGYFLPITAR